MSLHLKKYNAIYFHIQKTGGRWVGGALTRAGVECIGNHNGGNKNGFREVAKWCSRTWVDIHGKGHSRININKQFLFTFIRHPFAWYRSFWAQRNQSGWRPDWIDVYRHADFEKFIQKILEQKIPFVTNHFNEYLGTPRAMHFVGRTENMANDLIKVLDILNADYDKNEIIELPPVNISKDKPKCSKELIDRVIKLEDEIVTEYYKDTPYENYIYDFAKGRE